MRRIKVYIATGFGIILGVLLFISGCTTPTTSSPGSMPPVTTQPVGGPTYGSLAQQGQAVFASKCARCHGADGQGVTAPAVIGANAALKKYNNARGLLDFTAATMPMNATGSLSHQDYLNALSFLLVQNNYVNPAVTFDESTLTTVQLK